MYLINQLDYFG